MESYTLAENIIKAVSDKKGQDIILLDIHEKTSIADYFVICSGFPAGNKTILQSGKTLVGC